MLKQLDHIPEGLLSLEPEQLHDFLGGPTLIHLPGRQQPALLVSVLMHGNETTGWYAVRDLLRACCGTGSEPSLPRSLSLFISNTEAAKHQVRHLKGQPDYNRVWPGSTLKAGPEHRVMQEVMDTMAARGVFASVDIHNNTGLNPHYACVNELQDEALHLATLFSRTVVYFTKPVGVQAAAMLSLCPAVTLECGKVGQQHSTDHARAYVDACLHLSEHPQHPVAPHDIDLFHTTAIVKIAKNIRFGYSGDDLDLLLEADLEHYNFRELRSGTPFGKVFNDGQKLFDVTNEKGEHVQDHYFESGEGQVRTRVPVMPSMLTPDTAVIRQDCLCYLMERYSYNQ